MARMLAGERAKERLSWFEKARKGYNPKAQKTLGVCYINENGEIEGSNIFARCLLSKVSPTGTRIANILDLLQMSDRDGKYLRGTYGDDNAIVLRNLNDSEDPDNNYLARILAKKLKIRNIKIPLVITDLTIKEDEKSDYGLVLVPTDTTKVIEAPQLTGRNDGRRFTLYDANGMPIFKKETDTNGKRQVWTRDDGLSSLSLSIGLSLNSDCSNLKFSYHFGRTVELSREEAYADFEDTSVLMYRNEQEEFDRLFADFR